MKIYLIFIFGNGSKVICFLNIFQQKVIKIVEKSFKGLVLKIMLVLNKFRFCLDFFKWKSQIFIYKYDGDFKSLDRFLVKVYQDDVDLLGWRLFGYGYC